MIVKVGQLSVVRYVRRAQTPRLSHEPNQPPGRVARGKSMLQKARVNSAACGLLTVIRAAHAGLWKFFEKTAERHFHYLYKVRIVVDGDGGGAAFIVADLAVAEVTGVGRTLAETKRGRRLAGNNRCYGGWFWRLFSYVFRGMSDFMPEPPCGRANPTGAQASPSGCASRSIVLHYTYRRCRQKSTANEHCVTAVRNGTSPQRLYRVGVDRAAGTA